MQIKQPSPCIHRYDERYIQINVPVVQRALDALDWTAIKQQ